MKITNGLSEEEAIEDFGDMDELVNALAAEHRAELLAEMAEGT